MKKRILSILLCLCMVLMLCPVTAFAEETHTATFYFDHGTLQLGDVTVTDSPYALTFTEADGFILGSITDCGDYKFLYWKCIDPDTDEYLGVYESGVYIEAYSDIAFQAVYQEPPALAITVDGFEVGNTPEDITLSFESTIPGVTFSADDVALVAWNIYVEELGRWDGVYDSEEFQADTRYQLVLELNDKGLSELPAVTINGKTPERCGFNTDNRRIMMACEFGTPPAALTISGPDVVCAQQDYEFSVTTADGANFAEDFSYDLGWRYVGILTRDEDGIGHGVVPASKYGSADSIELAVFGAAADGTSVTVTKTVRILKEHRFVDGVCGCGAVQQYTVEYIGSGDDPICMDTKTHGEPLTLRGETFKMDGFVQTGWVDKETGAVYRLGDTYTENADVTLNPVFEKIITLTVPYTTTVELSDVGVPGEKTFTLALIGDSAPDKDKSNVTITGSVTTNGKGSYNGTLTFTGTERTLWAMLSEGAFVQQVDDGEAGWTVDDTVWGVLMEEIPVAYAMGDDGTASGYTVYVVPASIDGNGYYYIDWENLETADMRFTNTYTAHAYALNHDADGHWDECAGCKDVQNKEPHKYGDWKVIKEATQTAKGEKEHTCTVCGYTEKAEIPMRTNVPTGDDSSFALWAALFTLSAAAVTATATMGKRKKAGK